MDWCNQFAWLANTPVLRIEQMAQSWLGSGQPLPSESGDASAASEQTESSTSEGEDADMGDDEEDEDGHGDADADVDVDDGDEDADIMDAHPRGTKGRDMCAHPPDVNLSDMYHSILAFSETLHVFCSRCSYLQQ